MSDVSAEEIDFEVDADDLPEHAAQTVLGAPSVIVDDLHVHYRVFGAGKAVAPGSSSSFARRLLGKGRQEQKGIREVKAVRGVSFVARHGESIGIVGTNGSGKSTLLRALAGLIPPAGGNVYVSGTPSLLGVNAVLMKQLTGERNIMIGGLALGLTTKGSGRSSTRSSTSPGSATSSTCRCAPTRQVCRPACASRSRRRRHRTS